MDSFRLWARSRAPLLLSAALLFFMIGALIVISVLRS